MTNTNPSLKDANPFVAEVTKASTSSYDSSYGSVRTATNEIDTPARMRRFDGYLGPVLGDGRRKIYSSSLLNDGFEIPEEAILARRRYESETEGLERDVVWVDADADIIYFTRQRRSDRDPSGGTGAISREGRPGA